MHFSSLPFPYLLLQHSVWWVSARVVLQFGSVNEGLEALCPVPLLRRGPVLPNESHPADGMVWEDFPDPFYINSVTWSWEKTPWFLHHSPSTDRRPALCFDAASPTASPSPTEDPALVLISPTTSVNAQGGNLEGFNIPVPDLHHARFTLWLCFLSPCLAALLLPPSVTRLIKPPRAPPSARFSDTQISQQLQIKAPALLFWKGLVCFQKNIKPTSWSLCSAPLHTHVFLLSLIKKKWKKSGVAGGEGREGEEKRQIALLLPGIISPRFIGGGEEAAESKQQWVLWMVQPLAVLRVRC